MTVCLPMALPSRGSTAVSQDASIRGDTDFPNRCCLPCADPLQVMEEEAAVKRARKAAEAAFLQLLKDNTPPDAASTSPRELQCVPLARLQGNSLGFRALQGSQSTFC